MIKFAFCLPLRNKQSAAVMASIKFFLNEQKQKTPTNSDQRKDVYAEDTKVKIDEKYLYKSAALYDKYKQSRQKPLMTLDGYQIKFCWVLQRAPIFYPYQKEYFNYYKNRFNLAKKAGYYMTLPKQLIIQQGDYLFKEYERTNIQNSPSHQTVINGQTKYYRQNSRYWRYTDPSIIDESSVQTNSSDNVFFIVKNKQGRWQFPSRTFLQKQSHEDFQTSFAAQIFGGQAYPNIYFKQKKPIYSIRQERDDLEKGVGIKTFLYSGYSMSGIPKFPTSQFQQYKWVTKPNLSKYFSDQYFQKLIKLAQHSF